MDVPSLNTSAAEGLSVAVIGCGPAGMFFLRQLELERSRLLERKEALEADGDHFEATQIQGKISTLPRPTVFEKDSRCGGLWQSKSMVETDDTSEGMYDGMWINAPKENFEFEEYTFDDHFGRPMPSYITRSQVLGYLEGATKDAIDTYTSNGSIIFETEVSWIDFDESTNKFTVIHVPSGSTKEQKEDENFVDNDYFDKVILATGGNGLPMIPQRELQMLKGGGGISFDKPVLHSSQIKSLGDDITDMNFLFIGSAYSAEDLALSFIKRGANEIFISTRTEDAYLVTSTSWWLKDKVNILVATELKEVLHNNVLRMARRQIQFESPSTKKYADKFYDQSDENMLLDEIDAVIFCTGYLLDDAILANKLLTYAEYDGKFYNPEMKPKVDASHWPNIYDPSVFDPENGKILPSETNLNSCDNPIHSNNGMLRADPEMELNYDIVGTYNSHLVSNPGFFYHQDIYDTPLLHLDINAAFILKVIVGDIPTSKTTEEAFQQRSIIAAEWLRHSSDLRYTMDQVFADAMIENMDRDSGNGKDLKMYRPYVEAWNFFQMFLQAKKAGHSSGSFLMEVTEEEQKDHITERGCGGMENFRFRTHLGYPHNINTNETSAVYAFSERGLVFMEQALYEAMSRQMIPKGSELTFRDMHSEDYQSIYTGTKSARFSKPWIEIDDVLGDVGISKNAHTVNKHTEL